MFRKIAFLAALLAPIPALAVTCPAGQIAVTDANSSALCVGVINLPLASVTSTAPEASHVLKGSAGQMYSIEVTASSTSGYLMLFDATTAPANGPVAPKKCAFVPAGGSFHLSYLPGPALPFSVGITALFSTTGCFTATSSATAFFSGEVQ